MPVRCIVPTPVPKSRKRKKGSSKPLAPALSSQSKRASNTARSELLLSIVLALLPSVWPMTPMVRVVVWLVIAGLLADIFLRSAWTAKWSLVIRIALTVLMLAIVAQQVRNVLQPPLFRVDAWVTDPDPNGGVHYGIPWSPTTTPLHVVFFNYEFDPISDLEFAFRTDVGFSTSVQVTDHEGFHFSMSPPGMDISDLTPLPLGEHERVIVSTMGTASLPKLRARNHLQFLLDADRTPRVMTYRGTFKTADNVRHVFEGAIQLKNQTIRHGR